MKLIHSIAIAGLTASLHAQSPVVVVEDIPSEIHHTESIAKWLESIQKLNTQIEQLQQQIQIAETVKGYIGDPAAAADAIGLDQLTTPALSTPLGQLAAQINQTVDGTGALRDTAQGLFEETPQTTPSGFALTLDPSRFRPFEAIQKQSANAAAVSSNAVGRLTELQADKAATLAQLKTAPTQTEAQKLQAKLDALDGEIAAIGQQQSAAHAQLLTQDVANRNDRALKAQVASEAADQEMTLSIDRYSQWQGAVTSSRSAFR